MRVLGVNGYPGSSRRVPDSLLIQRRCRDQMMVLKLKQTRKDEDVKWARVRVIRSVFQVKRWRWRFQLAILCCAPSPGGLQNLFGSPGSGDPDCVSAPDGCLSEHACGGGTLSVPYLGHENRKRCSQKQFQRLCI